MKKRKSASSAQGGRRTRNAKNTGDEGIDFSDISALTTSQLKKAKRVGRPKSANPKQLIAVRIAPDLLHALKILAKKKKRPYQTLMHELLQQGIKKAA